MASNAQTATTIIHTVALDGDQNIAAFRDSTSKFKTIRVTIHTTGGWPNSPHSDNHVTIFLLLEQGGAVQVDMRTDPNDRRGQLVWKLVNYQQSLSQIKAFDYQLATAVEVWVLYRFIRYEKALHQYLFSAGGSGCHYWNYNLIRLMTLASDKFSLHVDVPNHVWNVFGKWYSRTGAERPNSILQGEFQNYAEWYEDWYGEDDEDDEEDEE
ncbi:hypothetical protein AOQ84DRAFT_50323 [Glonium stellatum]|uniref:DUF7770 domain-containing protein n=1 Tax=Glonium stellatum TaxID=574774 RepID=A0A8E2EZS8_9PEZI|nr:hypothetical protein AOQ84DRAFT_50323 [Glonium stellatum]